jgi:sortase (surface protein transpeptidase)
VTRRRRRGLARRTLPLAAALVGALLAPALIAEAVDGGDRQAADRTDAEIVAGTPAVAGPSARATAGPPGPRARHAAASAVRAAERPVPLGVSAAQTTPASAPTTLTIPSIGVETGLEQLAVRDDGRLAAPTDFGRAGWFAAGPAPGERGPAVIAGHVDSADGPAVFHHLDELRADDTIEVARADGTVVRFRVADVGEAPKDAFPTDAVYGPTAGPTLRLITCTGSFDRQARHYRSNLIVYAVAV